MKVLINYLKGMCLQTIPAIRTNLMSNAPKAGQDKTYMKEVCFLSFPEEGGNLSFALATL